MSLVQENFYIETIKHFKVFFNHLTFNGNENSSTGADFKVSPIYFYNPSDSKPVLPELLKTDKEKFIIFCDKQKRSLCKVLKDKDNFKTIDLNAGHMFTGKYKEVCEIITKNIIH